MEPSIEKRGKFYHLRYTKTDGKRSTVSTGCDCKAKAWLWAEEFLRELKSPEKVVLVSDALDAWEKKKSLEGGDLTKIRSNLRRIRKAFGHFSPIDDLNEAVQKYVHKRRQEVADSTIGREIQDLKAALNWAHNPEGGRLIKQAPTHIWFNAPSKARTKTASDDDLRRLSEALVPEGDWVKMAFYMAICTAQRQGATLELTVDRVNWGANHLEFKNPDLKGKRKGRATILIPEELKPMLRHACDNSKSGFVIEKNGRKVSSSVLYHRWVIVRARADLDTLWWHDLRRTWATMAARDKVDMIQISRQLGHSSIRITEEHYAHYHPDYMGEARNHAGRMLQNFL